MITFEIKYDLNTEKFSVSGNVNREGLEEIVDTLIRNKIGKGEDSTEANKLDLYVIKFYVDLSEDIIKVNDNCGNKGLRLGILGQLLSNIDTVEFE